MASSAPADAPATALGEPAAPPAAAAGRKITTLIFDLDGVLVDLCEFHRDLYIDAFNRCARMPGAHPDAPPLLTKDVHSDKLEGLSTRAKLRACRELFPGAVYSDDEVYNLKQQMTHEALKGMAFPGRTRTALAWAKAQGLRLAVYTNSIRATLEVVLAGLGVAELLEATMSNEEAPAPKPSPSGYVKLMAQMGVDPAEVCIFEDSAFGQAAARGSGANLIPVMDSLDMTPEFLAHAVAHKAPCSPSRLRIVVPMAGLGSGFRREGFLLHKHFLPTPDGRQLWEVVVDNLMPKHEPLRSATEVHLIVRAEQRADFKTPPHVHLHTVPGPTAGAACTVLTLRDIINDDVPLMIGNGDQFLDWDTDAFYRAATHPAYDGAISTFYWPRPDDLRWSYTALREDGTVGDVAEKRYIGPNATTGLYAWRRGADFVRHAEAMVAANARVNGEFYVAPTYHFAMAAGARIRAVDCEKFWGFGTPSDFFQWVDARAEGRAGGGKAARPALGGAHPHNNPFAFRDELARKYRSMWLKWGVRLPAYHDNKAAIVADSGVFAGMWTLGAFALAPAYAQLREALAPWAHAFQWFEPPPADGGAVPADGAQLHHTFFQMHRYPVPPEAAGGVAANMAAWAGAAQAALKALPPFRMHFRGVAPMRQGVVLCGYPPDDYAEVREALRAAAPCVEPHTQDVYHVTLLRWTAPLSAEEYKGVCAVLERFREEELGELAAGQWAVGLATLCMRADTLRPAATWDA